MNQLLFINKENLPDVIQVPAESGVRTTPPVLPGNREYTVFAAHQAGVDYTQPGDGLADTMNFAAISGLAAHWSGSSLGTAGTEVLSWTDETGNGNTATGTTGTAPIVDSGTAFSNVGKNALFGAVDEFLTVPTDASIENTTTTYVVACRFAKSYIDYDSSPTRWVFNKQNASPATVGLRINQTGFTAMMRPAGAPSSPVFAENADAHIDQCMRLMIVRATGSTLDHIQCAHGEKEVVASTFIEDGVAASPGGSLTIGKHPTATNVGDFPLHIYEMAIYNRSLSDAEIDLLYRQFDTAYPQEWRRVNRIGHGTGPRGCSIWIDGATAYMAYLKDDDQTISYKTAPISDPHNWTDSGVDIFTTTNTTRGICLVQHAATWYLYYDDRANGHLRVATGSALNSLSDSGSNPILTGTGSGNQQFVRHPFVIPPGAGHDGTNWHLLYAGRSGSVTSGDGASFHQSNSDPVTGWTNGTEIISPSGVSGDFEEFDAGEPKAYWNGTNYNVFWSGYSDTWEHPQNTTYPHWMAQGTSTDLTSVTKDTTKNPILPVSQRVGGIDPLGHTGAALYAPSGTSGPLYMYYIAHKVGLSTSGHVMEIAYAERAPGFS